MTLEPIGHIVIQTTLSFYHISSVHIQTNIFRCEQADDVHHVLGIQEGGIEYLVPLCKEHHEIFTFDGRNVKPFVVKKAVERIMELCPVNIEYHYCKTCQEWHFDATKLDSLEKLKMGFIPEYHLNEKAIQQLKMKMPSSDIPKHQS